MATHKKNGRPLHEFTDKEIQEIQTLSAVLNREQIADYFGISSSTFYRECERDQRVLIAYKKGKARAVLNAGENLIQKWREGDVTCLLFYLKTQGGWKEKNELALTGPDGEPIQHNHSINVNIKKE